jgi:iron complex transport system permease protein
VAVSLGGMISFAGLIVPHVARLLLGPDHVRLLPVTALGRGHLPHACRYPGADDLCSLRGSGGHPDGLYRWPFFLYLLRKMKRSYTV